MVLKNWFVGIKWTDYFTNITYYNRKSKYSYAQVWKTGLPLKEMKRRGHVGTYIFQARIGSGKPTAKRYFKTKSSAMTYLRGWMKKNG